MATDRAVTTHSFCPVNVSDMVGPEDLLEGVGLEGGGDRRDLVVQ